MSFILLLVRSGSLIPAVYRRISNRHLLFTSVWIRPNVIEVINRDIPIVYTGNWSAACRKRWPTVLVHQRVKLDLTSCKCLYALCCILMLVVELVILLLAAYWEVPDVNSFFLQVRTPFGSWEVHLVGFNWTQSSSKQANLNKSSSSMCHQLQKIC